MWESIISSGRDDLFQEEFEERVYEVYGEIAHFNWTFSRSGGNSMKLAIPVVKRIAKFIERYGESTKHERVKTHVEKMLEQLPEDWKQ